MDRYRDYSQIPKNRSFVQGGSINEDLISRVNYEKNKHSLLSILKFCVFFFLIILLCFLGGKIYTNVVTGHYKSNLKYLIAWVEGKIWREKQSDIIVVDLNKNTNKETISEEEILQRLGLSTKDCLKYRTLRNELKNQKFSLDSDYLSLPDFSLIALNPAQFGKSNEMNRSLFEENHPNQSELVNIFTEFNKMVPLANISVNSGEEDLQKVNSLIDENQNKYEKIDNFLDDDYVQEIKLKVNDLQNSFKNVFSKQKKLNKFREDFLDKMKNLKECKNNLNEKKDEIDLNKDKIIELERMLKSIENEVNNINQELNIKNQSINEEKNKLKTQMSLLRDKIFEFKNYLRDSEKIKSQNLAKESEIKSSENKIESLKLKLVALKDNQPKLNDLINESANDIHKLEYKKNLLKKQISISSAKLQLLKTNKEIKNFLDNLINKNAEVSDLAELMDSKIIDEKEILKEFDIFYELINQTDDIEETVVTIEGNNQEIINEINKDKTAYKEISSKFLALRREVEKYKNIDANINLVIAKINSLQSESQNLENDIKSKNLKLNQLEKEKKNDENIIIDEQNKIVNLREMIGRLRQEIDYSKKMLFETGDHLERLNKELDLLNKEYSGKFGDNKEFENLENKRNEKKNQIVDVLGEINALKGLIKKEEVALNLKSDDCAKFLIYFNETKNKIPQLIETFEKDKNILNEIKRSIIQKVNLFDNFSS